MKTIDFWAIPILTNCGFSIVGKKKYWHIPDANEHFKHSDYRADGICQYFFFRLHEIYKLVFVYFILESTALAALIPEAPACASPLVVPAPSPIAKNPGSFVSSSWLNSRREE